MPPKVFLLSRTLDPLLGVFTGLLAFHLHETNPRSAPPPGHSLSELISWKWSDVKTKRAMKDNEGEGDVAWESVQKELEGMGSAGAAADKRAA
jgi:hypothetical protein